MKIRPIETGLLLAISFFVCAARAGDLCDPGCELSITFPTGGTIEAVEALTFTFGDGCLVDTADSITAYLASETMVLNAGDSLVFDNETNAGVFDYYFSILLLMMLIVRLCIRKTRTCWTRPSFYKF